MSGPDRIARRFKALADEGRGGLVTFVTAGDPDAATSAAIIKGLPAAGADLIEIGMPFSDPMADGPAIQAASQRALKGGQTMVRTLAMVRDFRTTDPDTPIVLMGYYNPIYIYGAERFLDDARDAGVDGLIVVDLPPEEDEELNPPARERGISFVRLVAPTTGDDRLPALLADTGGFVYYVSVTGITGTKSAVVADVAGAMTRLRKVTDLPIAVGFGIRTPDDAAAIAKVADAAVVGSEIVRHIAARLDESGRPAPDTADSVLAYIAELAGGVRGARR